MPITITPMFAAFVTLSLAFLTLATLALAFATYRLWAEVCTLRAESNNVRMSLNFYNMMIDSHCERLDSLEALSTDGDDKFNAFAAYADGRMDDLMGCVEAVQLGQGKIARQFDEILGEECEGVGAGANSYIALGTTLELGLDLDDGSEPESN